MRASENQFLADQVMVFDDDPHESSAENHVLTNREGNPWIMRRRTQEEMDDLIREAGFAKERQETDPAGIFTVSVARKL